MNTHGCHTNMEYHQFELKWTLSNFTLCMELLHAKENHVILSTSFLAGDENNTKWHIGLQACNGPYGKHDIYFRPCYEADNKLAEIYASQTYFIVNTSNERTKIHYNPVQRFVKTASGDTHSGRIGNTIKQLLEKAHPCLLDGQLTIICQFHILNNPALTTTACHTSKLIKNDISSDIAKLFKTKKCADVTFIVRNKRIKAHKMILAARSSVFAAMFEHQTIEQIENEVRIPDIEPKVIEQMLQFIYTNEVTDINSMTMDLLAAADKYDLQTLKEMCGESLCNTITIDNAAATFKLADRHHIDTLMECTKNFISSHILEVMDTPGYQMMEKEDLQYATKLCRTSLTKKFKRN